MPAPWGRRPELATWVPAASVTRAIASATSNGCGSCRQARARAKRSAAMPSSGGTAPATSTISARLPLQCSATSQPAAITSRARSANGPPRAFMPRSSLITKPVSPIRSRITSPIITGEMLAGRRSSKAGSSTWAVMASGASRSARKGRKSIASSSAVGDIDAGQRQMAVGLGPAVAGHMLDHRQHAAGKAAFHHRAAQRDHDLGIGRRRRGRR